MHIPPRGLENKRGQKGTEGGACLLQTLFLKGRSIRVFLHAHYQLSQRATSQNNAGRLIGLPRIIKNANVFFKNLLFKN